MQASDFIGVLIVAGMCLWALMLCLTVRGQIVRVQEGYAVKLSGTHYYDMPIQKLRHALLFRLKFIAILVYGTVRIALSRAAAKLLGGR